MRRVIRRVFLFEEDNGGSSAGIKSNKITVSSANGSSRVDTKRGLTADEEGGLTP